MILLLKAVKKLYGNYINPLPDMPILDSSSSTASKDMMSKMWTNGDTDI